MLPGGESPSPTFQLHQKGALGGPWHLRTFGHLFAVAAVCFDQSGTLDLGGGGVLFDDEIDRSWGISLFTPCNTLGEKVRVSGGNFDVFCFEVQGT